MNHYPDGNPNYNQTEDNRACTMLAVANIAIWLESHLFTGQPSDQRLVNQVRGFLLSYFLINYEKNYEKNG